MFTRIGSLDLLDDAPTTVTIANRPYVIATEESGRPVVYDAVCPHEGGTVEPDDGCLRCPRHGWEFEETTGVSTNVPGESLNRYSTTVRDGHLYAEIPEVDQSLEFDVEDRHPPAPTVSLLAHATLSIEYDGFTLLTDPWLDGPAFLGAWTQYPEPSCDIERVVDDTDAIWITHEHSDHLHPPTLSHFPSDTPIFVPELNYRRLSNRLGDLGFDDVHSLPTGSVYSLAEGVEAMCFESNSTWNDSILALNCGGFRIVNFNDAGLNWEVHDAIPTADLVLTDFSFGASGYPLTWGHLDDDEKRGLVRDRNENALESCRQLVELFDPDYLLPFAKFFALAQPQHARYREILEMNRPSDVVERLEEERVQVLDLLPGERWHGPSGRIDRRPDRGHFFDDGHEREAVREAYSREESIVDADFEITHDEIAAYFEDLSDTELVREVGAHALTLTLTGERRTLHALVQFEGGTVTYEATDGPAGLGDLDSEYHLSAEFPGTLVQHVIRNDLSWDELHIGYWGKFDREPDVYNLAFWRLLHAPWEARDDEMLVADDYDIETDLRDVSMADLVEREDVGHVLANYGLYCSGCPAGLGEDIVEAARIHGLDYERAEKLIRSVEEAVSTGGARQEAGRS